MVLGGKEQHPEVSVIRNLLRSNPRNPRYKLRKRPIIGKREQPGAKVMVSVNRYRLAIFASY